jgi:hypothetical protein
LKHGRTTGWAAGSLNDIESNVQDRDTITKELCIINIPNTYVFSAKGDSGSTIIDFSGRIVGILHGGNGKAKRS